MEDFEEIVNEWKSRVTEHQKKHKEEAPKLQKLHFAVGIPAVVFSAIAGCTLFAQTTNTTVRVVAGALALLSAVFCALQTLLDFKARSEKHRSADARLGQIRKMCEIALAYKPRSKEDQKRLLNEISQQIAAVDSDRPTLTSNELAPLGS